MKPYNTEEHRSKGSCKRTLFHKVSACFYSIDTEHCLLLCSVSITLWKIDFESSYSSVSKTVVHGPLGVREALRGVHRKLLFSCRI